LSSSLLIRFETQQRFQQVWRNLLCRGVLYIPSQHLLSLSLRARPKRRACATSSGGFAVQGLRRFPCNICLAIQSPLGLLAHTLLNGICGPISGTTFRHHFPGPPSSSATVRYSSRAPFLRCAFRSHFRDRILVSKKGFPAHSWGPGNVSPLHRASRQRC
jgi:hypothetical protein